MMPTATSKRRLVARLAHVVNELSSPIIANPMVSVTIGLTTGSWAWTAALTVFTGVLPAAIIFGSLWLNRISDHHVTDRDERPLIMGAILSSLIAGLVLFMLASAPASILGVDAAMLATLSTLAVITVGLRWKISVHSAVWAGIAGMLSVTFGPWAASTFAIVPIVMWGRVHVQDHSIGQVIAGALVGGVVASSTFALFG